jgi:hypothetical protein
MVQINTTCNVEDRAASEGSRKGEATERVEPAGGERRPSVRPIPVPLRGCPETLCGITKLSQHEANGCET